MSDPIFLHRLQFAFTVIYHDLFPVLTMALLVVVMSPAGDGAIALASPLDPRAQAERRV
jgi:hypothetical protein